MSETLVLWDDASASLRMMSGVSGGGGGGGSGPMPFTGFFWDPAQKPATSNAEDDEFEASDLDPRWQKIGTWQKGGVERGASFTTPSGLVKYSINSDRPSHLVLQPVADGATSIALFRQLLPENLPGGNAPPNWLIKLQMFVETDKSSIPAGNSDNFFLFLISENPIDLMSSLGSAVGFFGITDYTDLDNPVTVGMVHITPPNDLDPVSASSSIKLPAIPSFNQLKLHKIGTMYRGYAVIDGRNVELGAIDLPTHNPKHYSLIVGNLDTPNGLYFLDFIRHSFVDKEAE